MKPPLAVGWIGAGRMGSAMCAHLVRAGHDVRVTSRRKTSAGPLIEQGAVWAESPAEVALDADVTFLMVGFPKDVRDVVFGAQGIFTTAKPGSLVIDMTTSQPSLAVEIHQEAHARGISALDAPVSGGESGAKAGTLSIMVGGDEQAVRDARPLLELLGSTSVHQGGPGRGQHAKMVNQILVASGMVGICEALLYAYRSGLDPATALRSITDGAAGSWALSHYGPRIIDGDFAPGFSVEHLIKDLEIALMEAGKMNLALPGLALAHELYLALRAQERERSGVQALVLALAELSSIDWPSRS